MLPFLCGKNAAEEQTLCREVQEAVESGRVTAELREKLGLPGNERVAVGLLRTCAPVSYTHLTLPTKREAGISEAAVS